MNTITPDDALRIGIYKTHYSTGNTTLFLQGDSSAGYTEGFDCQANCAAGDKWEIKIEYAGNGV